MIIVSSNINSEIGILDRISNGRSTLNRSELRLPKAATVLDGVPARKVSLLVYFNDRVEFPVFVPLHEGVIVIM